MSRLVIFIHSLALMGLTAVSAQVTEGIITYDHKINLHARLPEGMEEMKMRLPEFQIMKKELIFNAGKSIFQDLEDDTQGMGGGRGWMRMAGASSTRYTDIDEDTYVEKKAFMGDEFIIEDETDRIPWRLSSESKTILGMYAQRAWFLDKDEKYIEAWFTPEIPLSIGPDKYRGLPGAILELDIEYGEQNYSATGFRAKAVKDKDIKIPKGGKKVSAAEYEKHVEEKRKEFENSGNMRRFRSN
jgi:GLPGLI family protein